jgi:hypothetical protein
MMGPTHRALAVTTATGLSVACNASWDTTAVIVGTAYATAKLPDIDCRSWFPADHRTWTHWLLVTIAMALGLGLIVYGIGQGVAHLAQGPNGAELRHVGREGGLAFGILVGIGALCGTVTHTLADACTISGVPLAGPFNTKDRHLLPAPLRVRVNPAQRNRKGEIKRTRGGSEKRAMSLGEWCWLVGAWSVTGLIVYLGVIA